MWEGDSVCVLRLNCTRVSRWRAEELSVCRTRMKQLMQNTSVKLSASNTGEAASLLNYLTVNSISNQNVDSAQVWMSPQRKRWYLIAWGAAAGRRERLLLQSLSFKRLRMWRGQPGQGSAIRILRPVGHSSQTQAGCFMPAFLTGNLETPEWSELSCETKRSSGYKGLPAGSTKTEIFQINVIRTSNHISTKNIWLQEDTLDRLEGHTPLVWVCKVLKQRQQTKLWWKICVKICKSQITQGEGPFRLEWARIQKW